MLISRPSTDRVPVRFQRHRSEPLVAVIELAKRQGRHVADELEDDPKVLGAVGLDDRRKHLVAERRMSSSATRWTRPRMTAISRPVAHRSRTTGHGSGSASIADVVCCCRRGWVPNSMSNTPTPRTLRRHRCRRPSSSHTPHDRAVGDPAQLPARNFILLQAQTPPPWWLEPTAQNGTSQHETSGRRLDRKTGPRTRTDPNVRRPARAAARAPRPRRWERHGGSAARRPRRAPNPAHPLTGHAPRHERPRR